MGRMTFPPVHRRRGVHGMEGSLPPPAAVGVAGR